MGEFQEEQRLGLRLQGLWRREQEVVAALAGDPARPDVDPISVRRFLFEKFAQQREAMSAGDLSGLGELLGLHFMWLMHRHGGSDHYRCHFSWGPQAIVVWARADGEQEVVVRVDGIVESRARDLTDALHELGSRESDSIASYFVLVRTGDEWDIKDRVSESEGRHYETDELPGSAAELGRLHDEATIELATESPSGAARAAVLATVDGDARVRLLDLANVDDRFSPDVIAASVHQAVRAWEEATGSKYRDDHRGRHQDALRRLTTDDAFEQLTHPTEHGVRHVSRLEIRRLEIQTLSTEHDPPTVVTRIKLHGFSWIHGMWGVRSGSDDMARTFREKWTLALTTDTNTPWHVTDVEHPNKA